MPNVLVKQAWISTDCVPGRPPFGLVYLAAGAVMTSHDYGTCVFVWLVSYHAKSHHHTREPQHSELGTDWRLMGGANKTFTRVPQRDIGLEYHSSDLRHVTGPFVAFLLACSLSSHGRMSLVTRLSPCHLGWSPQEPMTHFAACCFMCPIPPHVIGRLSKKKKKAGSGLGALGVHSSRSST